MDCNDPQWKPSEFSLSLLCRSDLNRKFLIRCRDWEASENYKDIGEVRLCINDVLGKDDFEVEIKDKENKVTGYLRC